MRISDWSSDVCSSDLMEILRCLVNGDANKVIANRLDITEATVKVHMKSLLRTIKAANRTQAAIWALNQGLAPGLAFGQPQPAPRAVPPVTEMVLSPLMGARPGPRHTLHPQL